MAITGSLWRVRPVTNVSRYTCMTVMDECHAYRPWREDYDGHIIRSLNADELVIVSGEPQRVPQDIHIVGSEFIRMVPVVMPVVGWLNDTYFTKDSIWLERIA